MRRESPLPPKIDALGAENREEKGCVPDGLKAREFDHGFAPGKYNP